MSVAMLTRVAPVLIPGMAIDPHLSPYTGLSDTQVIIACQRKDVGAFEELLKRFQRFIHADIHRLAPDWSSIHDDLAQEVIVRMWRSIGSIRNPHAFKSWLHQLVINLYYDELRKRPRVGMVSLDAPINYEDNDSGLRQIADTQLQPDQLAEQRETIAYVNAAINTLSSQFRQALVMREMHGMAYQDIASITKTELGTVKSRIARGREKVQKQLASFRYAS